MRAMPSPTSMTVPTSDTCSFCSKPAISRFRTLVISATLMAISSPSVRSSFRRIWVEDIATAVAMPLSSWRGGEHLFLQRVQLRLDARVDELVLHAEDQAADDSVVDVLVDDRVLLQRTAHALADLLELLRRKLLRDRDVDLDLSKLLIEQVIVGVGDLDEAAEAAMRVENAKKVQHQLARLRAEDSLHRLAALLLADSRISQVHAKRFASGNDFANRAQLLCDRLGAIALVRQLEQRLSVRDGVGRGVLGFRHSCGVSCE